MYCIKTNASLRIDSKDYFRLFDIIQRDSVGKSRIKNLLAASRYRPYYYSGLGSADLSDSFVRRSVLFRAATRT